MPSAGTVSRKQIEIKETYQLARILIIDLKLKSNRQILVNNIIKIYQFKMIF